MATGSESLDPTRLRLLIRLAREEDLATRGDITGALVAADTATATVAVVARQAGVFAGRAVLPVLIDELCPDAGLAMNDGIADGATVSPGQRIGALTGPLAPILAAERTILNFIQRLSGVATMTRTYVDAVVATNAKIYDTRKTVPGWRDLDKYAVRCGGGHNHRRGLYDAVLIKDNHLAGVDTNRLAEAVSEMLNAATPLDPPPDFVEVEVDDLDQLREVLEVVGVDVVLLDNFSPDDMTRAVRMRDDAGVRDKVQLEASGGVDLDNVRAVARTGVDRIAIGAITHSAPALDIAFDRLA